MKVDVFMKGATGIRPARPCLAVFSESKGRSGELGAAGSGLYAAL